MYQHPDDAVPVPARAGRAVGLAAGDTVRIANPYGGQVVDLWAFGLDAPDEHLSMEHTRTSLQRLVPRVGDVLVSNRRRPMVRLLDDSSPGCHDTLVAACDPARYELLGAGAGHPNCTDNLRSALREVGAPLPAQTPSPLNLFMRVDWDARGELVWRESPARPGDAVELEACRPMWLVVSACPMDVNPINGYGPQPVELTRRAGLDRDLVLHPIPDQS